jgi:prepilin-type N-terminal cleavage/methylation domain-containing protein
MKTNIKSKIKLDRRGLTLIELMISIFIFSVVLIGILTMSVSTMNAYHKAKGIKTIKENAEYTISSIAKDVRMGNIVTDSLSALSDEIDVKRNRGGEVCYKVMNDQTLSYIESDCGSWSDDDAIALINLDGTFSKFDLTTTGFYSLPTNLTAGSEARGWVEINLNIVPEATHEMEGDQINVQTTVSARDYGWEEN